MAEKKIIKKSYSDIAKEYGIRKEFEDVERERLKLDEVLDKEMEITGSTIRANDFGGNSIIVFGELDAKPIMTISSSQVLLDIFEQIPREGYPFWGTFVKKVSEVSEREYYTLE